MKNLTTSASGLCSLPFLLFSASALAEGNNTETEDTMVVTASGIEQTLRSAPASISVITAEQLRSNVAKSATDLADVLSRITGVAKANSNDVGSGIEIRGMPAAYTLLLVDGKRISSSNGIKTTQQNYFDDINWIPIESIERIEIVRGPMSSLYGSDAMGGVVNIITKKNTKKWNGSLTLGTNQPQDSDAGDTNTYTGYLAGPLGNGFSLRMNGSWDKRDADVSSGADFDKNGNAINGLRWGRGREGKERYSYGADLDWDITDTQRVSVGYMGGREKGLEGRVNYEGSSYVVPLRGITDLERKNTSFDYQGIFELGTAKFAAYQNKYENSSNNIPIISNDAILGSRSGKLWSKDTVVQGDFNFPFELWLEQSATLGMEWKKEELSNPTSMGSQSGTDTLGQSYGQIKSLGFFVEDQLTLTDDLALTLGLRRDVTDFGNATTPRAFLVYQPYEHWTFKGGYSEGFKVPTVRQSSLSFIETSKGTACQMYGDYQGKTTPARENVVDCYTRGNESLKPEKSKSWEIGATYENQQWLAGLTFFDTRFKDKISSAPLGYLYGQSGDNINDIYWLQRVNLDSARTQGLEATLNIPIVDDFKSPWLSGLYLRNNITRMIKAEDSAGNLLTNTSKWASYSSLDWDIDQQTTASLSAQYYGQILGGCEEVGRNTGAARVCSGYTIWGLNAAYKATKNIKLNAGIDNLFDKNPMDVTSSGNYSSTNGNNFYIPGRAFYGNVTLSF